MSDYKEYPEDTRVRIISTGEEGEAFESAFGYISVAIDGNSKYRMFLLSDVEFLNEE